MFETGLVSISFRGYPVEQIVKEAAKAGLTYIEWGSDVHAPCKDTKALEHIVALQNKYGITCCSYGTYFRLGITALEELPDYIRAAKILGTTTLRLWAGDKSPDKYSPEEKAALFDQCRQAARIAEDSGVMLCMECHRNTFVETKEGAMVLMRAVDSANFGMYWQPNPYDTPEENLLYAQYLEKYVSHIHAFCRTGDDAHPLAEGIGQWQTYLKVFSRDHKVLLESMPDNRIESLQQEAATLRKIISI